MNITPYTFATLTPVAADWFDPLIDAMVARQITGVQRVPMFLATILYESGGLTRLEENLNYSQSRMVEMWPTRISRADAAVFEHHPELIANRVYANRNGNGDEASGDGWRYRGRGPTQLTGKLNYHWAEQKTGYPLQSQPGLLLQPAIGAAVSAMYWALNGCNAAADQNDFPGTQAIINRGDRARVADNLAGRLQWLLKVKSAIL